MDDRDSGLGRRLHGAYDRMAPSPEVEERMLANLLAHACGHAPAGVRRATRGRTAARPARRLRKAVLPPVSYTHLDAVFPSKRSHARPFERFRPFYHDGGHGGRRPASLPLLLAADGCGVMDKKSAIPWIFLAPERICERFSRKRLFNCTKTESFSKGDKESRRFCPVAGRRFRPAKVAFCSGSGRRIPPAMCVLRAFFLRLDAV